MKRKYIEISRYEKRTRQYHNSELKTNGHYLLGSYIEPISEIHNAIDAELDGY
ncbi:hypothetical protein [Sulfurimonas sp.]|jgi:hypothetical protein|uniref:hypothetical protein n=1 Tax=Sulfurimonas sp. TaxID=2022749 RepID=UPI0025F708B7|nr:hypothetical protein [Sulfurimonas sp.]MCK9474199.1 hypothetical protein [Sulfurimonas sp.]